MSLEQEIECKNCGNSCTVHYQESPYDDHITYCPFCGNEIEDEYEEDEDEPF